MTSLFRQALFFLTLVLYAHGDPSEKSDQLSKVIYQVLDVKKSVFGDFAMIAQERDDYASSLARFAVESAHSAPSDASNMSRVRRFIGLALHLSPRNRTAVISNQQLGRGLLPEMQEGDYSRAVFSRLLLTRGRLLKKQPAKNDQFVGRCFIELAAELDARNEEALYDSEIQRLDGNEVDWSLFTASLEEEKDEKEE